MKKKILIIIGIISIIVIIGGYFGVFLYQNNKVNKVQYKYLKTLDSKNFTEEVKKKYTLKRCNFNIIKPEYYQVAGGDNDALITFYKFDSIFLQDLSSDTLDKKYLGFSRVRNTTFPQLLKMVQEDCEQFKIGSEEIKKQGIIWSYSKYDRKEEEQRKKERAERKKRKLEEKQKMLEAMSEEERKIYEQEQERLRNRTEEEILRDKGYSEEEIKERMNIEWETVEIK